MKGPRTQERGPGWTVGLRTVSKEVTSGAPWGKGSRGSPRDSLKPSRLTPARGRRRKGHFPMQVAKEGKGQGGQEKFQRVKRRNKKGEA